MRSDNEFLGECDWDPCGLCDFMWYYRKVLLLLTYLLGGVLLVTAMIQYGNDFEPFHKLDDFAITARWVSGPRSGCPYNGLLFDCYDGYVLGNYTDSLSVAHSCTILVDTDFQLADVWAAINTRFPQTGPFPMWSPTPDLDNTCVLSVNSHSDLFIAAAVFLSIACAATLYLFACCCRDKIKTHRKNVRRQEIHSRVNPVFNFQTSSA